MDNKTSRKIANESNDWILYDGECPMCLDLVKRFKPLLASKKFQFKPLQNQWVKDQLQLPPSELLKEMRVLTNQGFILGGADAILYIAKSLWWGQPLYLIAQIPGVKPLLYILYSFIAQRRHCINGACQMHRIPIARWKEWVPLLALPLLTLFFKHSISAWAFMWLMAFALFFGFKWLTFWEAKCRGIQSQTKRVVAYLLLWPGMDADLFLSENIRPDQPALRSWLFASLKTFFGIVLIWGVVRFIPTTHPMITGWISLVGLIFLLHFGTFHLIALVWQSFGVSAQPIMQAPILATSLSEFWSKRWNLGFRQLTGDFVFHPLRTSIGAAPASIAAFLVSGFIHELVISFPANAGYGLPTLYFLLQGLGVSLEYSSVGKRLNLNRDLSGWLFTFLLTAGPAFWLFHPPFIRNVVIPFMVAIKAL